MKNLYLILLACLLTGRTFAQTRSINKFINQHKTESHALAVNVPGWMLDIVSLSANFIDEDDKEAKELLKLSDKISRVRFMIIDDGPEVSKKDIRNLISGLKNENFEELISVRSEGTHVKLMIKEKKDEIRNITAFITSEDATILMTLSGRFKLDELKNLEMWNYDKAEEEMEVL
jgi:hypothetical protein